MAVKVLVTSAAGFIGSHLTDRLLERGYPMAQSILVTGGAGFIGSHIINRLAHERREVLVLDNLSSGKIENLAPQMKEDLVELIKGDVRDDSLVALLSSKVEAIDHLAAVADHEA